MPDSQLALITKVGGEHPDHELPPESQWPPNLGHPLPPYPSNGLPDGGPIDPGFGRPPILIPAPPHIDNGLPPVVWPGVPIHPIDPGFGVGGGGGSTLPVPPTGSTLPIVPGQVWPPLPDVIEGLVLALVWIPGVGYRWCALTAGKPGKPPVAGKPPVVKP